MDSSWRCLGGWALVYLSQLYRKIWIPGERSSRAHVRDRSVKPRHLIAVAGLITLVLAASSTVVEARPGGIHPVQNVALIGSSRARIDEFCVNCHNQRSWTAGLALDTTDLNDIPAGAEVWEKVVRKLRIGMMPPDGARRPNMEDAQALVSMLETSLDQAAAQNPNPERRLIHVSTNGFEPSEHDGHNMGARVLLYLDERDALLNVTSLQMVACSCSE